MLHRGSVSPETAEDQTANEAQKTQREGPRAKDDHCHQEVHDRHNHQEVTKRPPGDPRKPPGISSQGDQQEPTRTRPKCFPPIQRWDQGQNQDMTMMLSPMSSGPWAKCLPLLCTGGIQTHCVRIYMESEFPGHGAREGLCKSWSKKAIALYMHCTANPPQRPGRRTVRPSRERERDRERKRERE